MKKILIFIVTALISMIGARAQDFIDYGALLEIDWRINKGDSLLISTGTPIACYKTSYGKYNVYDLYVLEYPSNILFDLIEKRDSISDLISENIGNSKFDFNKAYHKIDSLSRHINGSLEEISYFNDLFGEFYYEDTRGFLPLRSYSHYGMRRVVVYSWCFPK